ncbi:hypothetical protein PMAYCL1PPCAC_05211, partial [Pristionchus mayeri]
MCRDRVRGRYTLLRQPNFAFLPVVISNTALVCCAPPTVNSHAPVIVLQAIASTVVFTLPGAVPNARIVVAMGQLYAVVELVAGTHTLSASSQSTFGSSSSIGHVFGIGAGRIPLFPLFPPLLPGLLGEFGAQARELATRRA